MTSRDAASTSGHADDAALEALLSGALPAPHQRDLETHLGDCASCRDRLDAIAASAERWSEVRAELSSTPEIDAEPGPTIPALVHLVKKLLAPSDDDRGLGRLGPYEIAGIVGSGGMGIVLKGHDRSLDRFVAIKLLAPHLAASGAARQRFLREAKAAAAVVHDNVIAIHGVDEFAGLPYLVMPYCRGTTLEKRLRDSGPLAIREILRVGTQTARGLAAAHAQGLVHRDVKPGNILLDDGVERVRITDFGLARAADDASLTVTGLLAGTPHYMSPEQALGKPLDARSDLFALGGVLFTMATGKPPFRAESSHAVLRQVTDAEPADVRLFNPDLPDWFAGIVRRLLAKDPAGRFQSAAEVAGVLEGALAHVNRPLATPLPSDLFASQSAPPRRLVGAASIFSLSSPGTLLDSVRRLMSDQRILSITALVLLLVALLLPWPIAALGRDEPALAFAAVAALASLGFAWLGRRDSLGRLVLKLVGGAAAIAVPVVGLVWGAFEASVARNLAREQALRAQQDALKAQLVRVTRPDGPDLTMPVPATVPQSSMPRVAPGPDPMPVVTWPAGRQPAGMPPVATMMSPTPATPGGSMMSPPPAEAPAAASLESSSMATSGFMEDRSAYAQWLTVSERVEGVEKFLAEHPFEAIADVTEQHYRSPGNIPVPQRIEITSDHRLIAPEDHLLAPATLQREFTTAFLGQPVPTLFRDARHAVLGPDSTVLVQTPVEDGDGYQQQFLVVADATTGAILTKERQIRFTLDGRFRTIDRTVASDFREIAPGIRLPHAIDIDFYHLEADKPENAIPNKQFSLRAVVHEWRAKAHIVSPQNESDALPAAAPADESPPETPTLPAATEDPPPQTY